MNLAQLTNAETARVEAGPTGEEIGRAARRKQRREDSAETIAIIEANAREKTVTYQRSYRVGSESRVVRERVAPASRLNGRELLSLCREAVRLGCHRLERSGMRISDEDRLDAAAELCARTLAEADAPMPKRDDLTITYMRERAAGIVVDNLRKYQREVATDDFDLVDAVEGDENRAAENAPDPYLADAVGDPANPDIRDAARAIDPWPHSPVEAAILHHCQPKVPSTQWAAHENVKPSSWRSRVSGGLRELRSMDRERIGAALEGAEPTDADDDAERQRMALERMIGERP